MLARIERGLNVVFGILDKIKALSVAEMGKYGAAAASVLAILAVASTNAVTISETFSKFWSPKVGLSLIQLRVSPAGSSYTDMDENRNRPLQFVIDKTAGGTLKGCFVETFVEGVPLSVRKFNAREFLQFDRTPQEKFTISWERMLIKVSIGVNTDYTGRAAVRVVCDGYISDLGMVYIPPYDEKVVESD